MLCFEGIDTVDYSLYPTKDVQLRWLRGYLEEKRKLHGSSDDVSNAELEELYRQTNKCALVGKPTNRSHVPAPRVYRVCLFVFSCPISCGDCGL